MALTVAAQRGNSSLTLRTSRTLLENMAWDGLERLRAHEICTVVHCTQGMALTVVFSFEFLVLGSQVFTWVGSPSGDLAAGAVQGTLCACSSMFTSETEDTFRPSL